MDAPVVATCFAADISADCNNNAVYALALACLMPLDVDAGPAGAVNLLRGHTRVHVLSALLTGHAFSVKDANIGSDATD